MSWLDGIRHRAHNLLHPEEHEQDTLAEIDMHLELDAMQQRDGTRARQRFGNRTYYMEERRQTAGIAFLDSVRQDALYAWRSIRRSPGFTAAVIVTLALGIGINAATFSMLDALFLRTPGGVSDPKDLRRIWVAFPSMKGGSFEAQTLSYKWYRAVAEATGDTTSAALYQADNDLHLGRGRAGEPVHVTYTTANYFRVLGVHATLGRLYSPAEDVMGNPINVCLVSDHFWRSHLRGDSAVLGDTIRIETQTYRVLGVLPRNFSGLDAQAADVFIPFAAKPPPPWLSIPRWWEIDYLYGYRTIVRLPVSLTDAELAHRATFAVRRAVHARTSPPPGADTLTSISTGSLIEARGPAEPEQDQIITTRLGGVAAIVLIIACANVLNLLLARALPRRREIALRLALGISRVCLHRPATTETLLLAAIASGAAVIIGWWSGTLLRHLLLPEVEWYDSVLGWRLSIFTVAVGAACGLLAGLVTALQSSTPSLTPALKDGARDTSRRMRSSLRTTLLAVQAALSIVLLAGAALFTRSLQNVTTLDIGFDRDRLVFASVSFDREDQVKDAVLVAGLERVSDKLRRRPDVESIALSGIRPMAGFSFTTLFTSTDSVREDKLFPSFNAVSGNFFATTGLKFLRGRPFEEAAFNVVINDAMANALWPHHDAIGECLYLGSRSRPCYRVTGVVENGRRDRIIEDEAAPMFYLPFNVPDSGRRWTPSVLNVRVKPGAQMTVTKELRTALKQEFSRGYPSVTSMAEQLDRQYRPWRLGAQLFSAVSLLALVVALVGIYSTVSYGVSQRTQEFGVRVALGAQTGDVLRQVLGEGLGVVTLGVALGVALTVAGGRLIGSLLYGVKPSDPLTLAAVGLALLGSAALAAFVPAWRAARVDPVKALRAE